MWNVKKESKTARIKYSGVQVHIYANLMYIPTAAAAFIHSTQREKRTYLIREHK